MAAPELSPRWHDGAAARASATVRRRVHAPQRVEFAEFVIAKKRHDGVHLVGDGLHLADGQNLAHVGGNGAADDGRGDGWGRQWSPPGLSSPGLSSGPLLRACPPGLSSGPVLRASVGRRGQMRAGRLQAPARQLDVLAQLIETIGEAERDGDVVHSPLDVVELA